MFQIAFLSLFDSLICKNRSAQVSFRRKKSVILRMYQIQNLNWKELEAKAILGLLTLSSTPCLSLSCLPSHSFLRPERLVALLSTCPSSFSFSANYLILTAFPGIHCKDREADGPCFHTNFLCKFMANLWINYLWVGQVGK